MVIEAVLRPDIREFFSRRMVVAGLSVPDLAEKAGVSKQTIYNLLRGDSVNQQTLNLICIALGLERQELLRAEGSHSEESDSSRQ